MASWYAIRARGCGREDARAEVAIYDEIGAYGVSAKGFLAELGALPDAAPIDLRLNSPGGSVFDAVAIYNALQRHAGRVTVWIDGIAASAASYVAMAGDEIVMPENAFLMIHDPAGLVMGTAGDMRAMAEALDKVKASLVAGYAAKSGRPSEEIAALMAAETWFDAGDALTLGLATRMAEPVRIAAFVCRQFKKHDVLWASEIQGVRDFGSETATQQVQTEVAYRLRKLRQDAETTFEYHLLNGIQGIVKDPKDHATVVNYFTEFGISPAAEIDFDLDNATPASGALRKRCQALIESVEESMGGLSAGAVQVRAECGSAFFADLVAHKEVRETYLNTAAAADLRGRVADEVSFGGITFRRYRGGVGFGVPTDKAYFYPEGIEGLFEIYYAPADTFETVNTLGQPLYARTIPDRDRDEWVRLEIESNPLPICTRPQVLRSARRT